MLEYKGFKAQIDFDERAGLFVGEIVNAPDGAVFCGRSVDELRAAFEEAAEKLTTPRSGDLPSFEKRFTGRISVRIKPEMHRDIAERAAEEGRTVAEWAAHHLAEALKSP